MKKIFAIFISLSLVFSIGCSRKIDQGSENIKETDKGQVSENENIEEITDTEDVNTEDVSTEEYEELSKIAEKINVQDYDMYVESDNKGTRIILFEDNGRKMYKSIFVKENRQLKLIDLQSGEEPLINDRI